MKIACLGWGSLIWDPRYLPVKKPWFKDGPLLPIEFARHSKGDRITLVIVPGVDFVRSLWSLMSVQDLEVAKRELAESEGVSKKNINQRIGHWTESSTSDTETAEIIQGWATRKLIDAVIWTALKPRFCGEEGRVPSVDEVISFLKSRQFEKRKYAEEYVRRAPLQIDTEYRRHIEMELGWTPLSIDE